MSIPPLSYIYLRITPRPLVTVWLILNCIQFLLFGVWTIVCAITGMLVHLLSNNSKAAAFVSRIMWSKVLLLIAGIRLEIYGQENLESEPSKIYVANHESHLDIPVCFAAVPNYLYFIAKKELRKVPFLGWYMIAVGMIFVDRKDREKAKESMLAAGKLIKEGRNVVSFPEGTRSKTGEMALFRRGSFVLAKESEIPVVPMAIWGAGKAMAATGLSVRPGTIRINIGKPMHALPKESPEEMAQRVQDQVVVLRAELKRMDEAVA